MTGSLVISGNLNKWTDDEIATASKMIAFYKQIRPTVQDGNCFGLAPRWNRTSAPCNTFRSDSQQAVVFAFLHSQQFGRSMPLHVFGRSVRGCNLFRDHYEWQAARATEKLSGSSCVMDQLRLRGDYDAAAIRFDRVP